MTQNERARLLLRYLLDFLRQTLGDPADPQRLSGHRFAAYGVRFATRGSAFGDHYDREMTSRSTARRNLLADFLDIVGNLGNENNVGRPREARVQRNESGVPAHHLKHNHAIVARSEEYTSELQSPYDLVCRLLLEKKKPK